MILLVVNNKSCGYLPNLNYAPVSLFIVVWVTVCHKQLSIISIWIQLLHQRFNEIPVALYMNLHVFCTTLYQSFINPLIIYSFFLKWKDFFLKSQCFFKKWFIGRLTSIQIFIYENNFAKNIKRHIFGLINWHHIFYEPFRFLS